MDSSKRQVHVNKKDPTRSITYRLSEKLVSELETENNTLKTQMADVIARLATLEA